MKIKTEEITRCYLNSDELMILCKAVDLIKNIKLDLGKREFGNSTWNAETIGALAEDINLLMLKCNLESKPVPPTCVNCKYSIRLDAHLMCIRRKEGGSFTSVEDNYGCSYWGRDMWRDKVE